MNLEDTSFSIRRIEVWPLRASISTPRRNAFGTMKFRPALFVKIELAGNACGWGEVFANWPTFGMRHRARIISDLLAPIATGRQFESPDEMYGFLEASVRTLALQSGEHGPFAQTIAGLDIAVWDALAKRENVPLWYALSADAGESVRVYASGITADIVDEAVPRLRDQGWNAFKLKIGFSNKHDRKALDRLRRHVGVDTPLMVDANQAWSLAEAHENLSWLSDYDLTWIEEPVPADTRDEHWSELVEASKAPLAAGENLRGEKAFADAAMAGIAVLQPDPIKWGGLSGTMKIARLAMSHGKMLAPHYLGGAVGLAATHALAISGGASYLEMDVTENPLRSELWGSMADLGDGNLVASSATGHGVVPDQEFLARFSA